MPVRQWKFVEIFGYLLPWLILPILLLYTYLEILHTPYIGFDFNRSTGHIQEMFVESHDRELLLGDTIVAINAIPWNEETAELHNTLFSHVSQGDILNLQVNRDGQIRQVNWVIPGLNPAELQSRLVNAWLLGYTFWFASVATILFVRPRNAMSLLLNAFFLVTAVWLVAGNTSRWNLWESRNVFRIAIWLAVPIYLHLHWIVFKSLAPLPTLFLWVMYGTTVLIALCQWFGIIPPNVYAIAFVVTLVGSAALLVAHYIRQPSERSRMRFLLGAFVFTIIPVVGLAIASAIGTVPRLAPVALLALPIIPGAYFYTLYRYQLGGLELRANHLISLYLFVTLLGSLVTLLFALLTTLPSWPSKYLVGGMVISLLVSFFALQFFPRFQRLIEYHLLGVKFPPADLLETYAARITTSLTQQDLVRLLQEEVLPSLLIRQSALLFNALGKTAVVYCSGLDASALPSSVDLMQQMGDSTLYLPHAHQASAPHSTSGLDKFPWIQVAIPIRFEERLIGVWLFGRRDPDDLYSHPELTLLQTLAYQTAIALVNIEQAQQLRALYQANIDRHETERAHLAHLLHDDILGGLSRLNTSLPVDFITESYEAAYQSIKQHALQMITGLRPALLNYGLCAALEELTDDLNERADESVVVQFDVEPTAVQLPEKVEEYLFRIIQQACENCLRHSHASTIRIYGFITTEMVNLHVVDDGRGFDTTEGLSLARLLANKHFGLVGMYERAVSIGAELFIDSAPERGTSVQVTWEASALPTGALSTGMLPTNPMRTNLMPTSH